MILLQNVPYGYEYCFAGKDKCPQAATCRQYPKYCVNEKYGIHDRVPYFLLLIL